MNDTITVPRELAERTKRDLQAAADRITSLEAKLADWERRSESCESKLGQLEVNEQVIALEAKVRELEAELETERMRLAGCGVAALGYFDGCKDEYKSASLGDVLQLRDQLTASQQQVERLVGCLTRMSAIPWGNYEATKPYRDIIDEALLAIEQETKERP